MSKDYYKRGGIECKDVIRAWSLSYNLGCVIKYVCRAGYKSIDPGPDLEKAREYLLYEIEATGKEIEEWIDAQKETEKENT